jgi:hypothetical protein
MLTSMISDGFAGPRLFAPVTKLGVLFAIKVLCADATVAVEKINENASVSIQFLIFCLPRDLILRRIFRRAYGNEAWA